ncbi:hypothetical protein Emed_006163 [Eimeria media]
MVYGLTTARLTAFGGGDWVARFLCIFSELLFGARRGADVPQEVRLNGFADEHCQLEHEHVKKHGWCMSRLALFNAYVLEDVESAQEEICRGACR